MISVTAEIASGEVRSPRLPPSATYAKTLGAAPTTVPSVMSR